MEHSSAPTRSRGIWTFHPVLYWLLLSAALFAWRFHYTHAATATLRFTVTTEKRLDFGEPEASLDGSRYRPGEPSGLGRKTLRIEASEHDTIITNVIVGYWGLDLGDIRLPRSHGRLELSVSPAARLISIAGADARTTLTNVARESLSLPTGRYIVKALFERFQEERQVDISASQTERLSIATNLVALHLASEPDGAEFELISRLRPSMKVSGVTPIVLTGLPVGDYTLDIARGTYRKTLAVTLAASQATNEVSVVFEYATLAVESDPPGAVVLGKAGSFGTTPLTLRLAPGTHSIRIEKPDYSHTNLTATLSAKDHRTVSVQLVNLRYQEAMSEAARKMGLRFRDHGEILELALRALDEKPGDPAAAAVRDRAQSWIHQDKARELLRRLEFEAALAEIEAARKLTPQDGDMAALQRDIVSARVQHLEEQRMAQARAEEERKQVEEQRRQAEAMAQAKRAEERRQRPARRFQQALSGAPHADLFEAHVFRLSGTLDSVYRRLAENLKEKPEWRIRKSDLSDPDIAVIEAESTSFGRRHRAVIVAGQTEDQEVTLHAKLIILTLGNNIEFGLGGVSDGSYIPLHPRHVTQIPATSVEDSVARATRTFLARLPR